jgi:hypothetical protein
MNSKKIKVIAFLLNIPEDVYEAYNEAFSVYRVSENKDVTAEMMYNRGHSEANMKNLLYDLQKAYEITDLELLDAKTLLTAEKEIQFVHGELDENGNPIIPQELDENGNPIVPHELDENGNPIIPQELDENAEDKTEAKEFVPAPSVEERKKIRDDFPFLKDEDCPNELKVLVTDKINAYEDYLEASATLLKHANGEIQLSDEDIAAFTRKSVESFEENRLIYDELNHYREKGKVLGLHPIFKTFALIREVSTMTQEELMSFHKSSPAFFSKKKKELEKFGADEDKKLKIEASVEARNQKLTLVNEKLGIK